MKTRLFSGVVAILIATCMLGGCVPKSAAVRQPDKFKIVASFYPLYIIAKNVVGDAPNVELVNMTSALGDCLHDYALLPSDLIKLEDANVLLINEENNWNVPEGVATVDVGGEEHEWLSFDGAITYAHVIADELGKIDSNNRAIYNENANLFIEKIRERRAIMSSQIANVSNKNVVVAHEGFEFIMRDLGLNVVAITQVEHDAEMTPTDIDNTIRAMKETGVRVIFVPVEDEIAAGITTIAREMGDEIKVVGLSSLVSGEVETYWENDKMKVYLKNATTVLGVPYDMPVVGYNGKIVNTLRLWSARSPKYIDMNLFSSGSYTKALEEKELAELLSKVLYPEDNHFEGKNLRLRQQYFFTSATIQWIVRSMKKKGINLSELPKHAQIHINDTHPAIAIPELMRILMDEEGMGWDESFKICTKVFAYTNHTVLSEALEKWPQDMIKTLLPRVYTIIEEIHHNNEEALKAKFGEDWGKINYMNIMSNGQISMANLCLAMCSAVNGVSALHTNILKKEVFKDYYSITPDKFKNVTNGITFRRWLNLSNPRLTDLITNTIGDGFNSNQTELKKLEKYTTDSAFVEQFASIKRANKVDLANYLQRENGIIIDPDSIFDVQIKRLHEYKRQLLNILHILYLYNKIIANPEASFYPHTFIFAAKASPGYQRAKLIIKLINSVAEKVNNDPIANKKLKVVFMENYGVSIAQKIIPATDISEQISTAGKEASGTSNMKFMLNGAVTIGTLDGANVEMSEILGNKNIYIFGLKSDEVSRIYQHGNQESKEIYSTQTEIRKVLDNLVDDSLSQDKPHLFSEIYQSLLFGDNNLPDPYMVIRDFESYAKTHEKMWKDYLKTDQWNAKAINNVANSGHFSSDRCIEEYNKKIWKLKNN